jgi:hypothetical protein
MMSAGKRVRQRTGAASSLAARKPKQPWRIWTGANPLTMGMSPKLAPEAPRLARTLKPISGRRWARRALALTIDNPSRRQN